MKGKYPLVPAFLGNSKFSYRIYSNNLKSVYMHVWKFVHAYL